MLLEFVLEKRGLRPSLLVILFGMQELKTADDGSIKASLKMEDLMTQVTDNLGTIAAGVVRQAYEAEVDRQLSVQAHEASAPQPHDQVGALCP